MNSFPSTSVTTQPEIAVFYRIVKRIFISEITLGVLSPA